MCPPGGTTDSNAAAQLAILLTRVLCTVSNTPFKADDVRKLIRDNWSKLCLLAHAVHDEETSRDDHLKTAITMIAALGPDGLDLVVKGFGAPHLKEAFKLLAERALKK